MESEQKTIRISGACRECGAPREAAGITPESLRAALGRLDAYVCEPGDHFFKPGVTLLEAYNWSFPVTDQNGENNQES